MLRKLLYFKKISMIMERIIAKFQSDSAKLAFNNHMYSAPRRCENSILAQRLGTPTCYRCAPRDCCNVSKGDYVNIKTTTASGNGLYKLSS